mgnify:CR=1 FL=1
MLPELAQAGIGPDDLDFIDLYSCFPIAVEVGAEELGLSLDDPRGLTVTGGLPYMGGPGNNYAMHSIAVMMQRLRDNQLLVKLKKCEFFKGNTASRPPRMIPPSPEWPNPAAPGHAARHVLPQNRRSRYPP